MRAILLSAFAVTALAGQAAAADLPTRKEAPAPYIAPPMFTWTGFYGGLNAGYAFGNNSVNTTSTNTFAFPAAGGPNLAAAITGLSNFGARPNNNGFIGGGQIGYNWQFSSAWVGGIETDLDGLGSGKGSAGGVTSMVVPGFPANTVTQNASVTHRLDYLGTLRARLGFLLMPNFLVFGTSGLAYSGVNASTSITQTLSGPNALLPPTWGSAGSIHNTRVGWALGGGFEWMFAPNWSAKVEDIYYNLGAASYNVGPLVTNAAAASPFTINAVQSKTTFSGDTIRVGVNLHF